MRDWCLISASNDEKVLHGNLLLSDLIQEDGITVHIERGAPSAGIAYNRAMDATNGDLLIFAHQDVYFPPGFLARLDVAISDVEEMDSDWAVIAPFGISMDAAVHRGDVWSTSLGRRVGASVQSPVPAQSFDELVIILRRSSGLRFDEKLPLFHLYGTDIVQAAHQSGKGAYIVDLPVVHNDRFHGRLGADFSQAYHYVRRKWRDNLPLRTPILWIDMLGFRLAMYRLRARRSFARRRAVAMDNGVDPRVYSSLCGWESRSSG